MLIYAVADLHGRLPRIPPCDLLLVGGDICPVENHALGFQEDWLDSTFRGWLESVPAKTIVGVAGNHDLVFDHGEPPSLPWMYLEDDLTEVCGLKIYGTPYQSKFGWWPFMRTEKELRKLWADMPKCDLVLSHGPPHGAGDRNIGGLKTGTKALAGKLSELEIPVCVCGHIHEAFGVHRLGRTTIYNVAQCDEDYQFVDRPVEIRI